MQKLGFSGLSSGLDRLRSLRGSDLAVSRVAPAAVRSSDAITYGSFTNLKLTAEKLVKEQASAKAELDMAQGKLKKSTDQLRALETKLQESNNENAKLQVKLKEDTKLWNGLDSKLSSTKTLTDQLTETLHHLAERVREAEEDKRFFGSKLSESSKAFEEMHLQVDDLSRKLDSADKKVQLEKLELMKLRVEKDETEKRLEDQLFSAENLMKQKDGHIRQLEASAEDDRCSLADLTSQLKEMQISLNLKEDVCKSLHITQENLKEEKGAFQNKYERIERELLTYRSDIKCLQDSVCDIKGKADCVDKYSLHIWDNYVRLSSSVDTFYKLTHLEKELKEKLAQQKHNQLQDKFLCSVAENGVLRTETEELKNKVIKLHKVQENVMAQHVDEWRLAEEKIKKLEQGGQEMAAKKIELEGVISKLEAEIKQLLEISSLNDNQMQDLLLKVSNLELEKQNIGDKMQTILKEKSADADSFQKLLATRDQELTSLQNEINHISGTSKEKELLLLEFREKENQLQRQLSEMQASLAVAESTLKEVGLQHELSLQGKDLELSKHLNEISQRNDQAINDIRSKFEAEKLEIAILEKEKAEKVIGEIGKKCEQRIAQSKEEAIQEVKRLEDEHRVMINQIHEEHEKKEMCLKARHTEELQQIELQSETELRQAKMTLRIEHETQIASLKQQHDDEIKQLRGLDQHMAEVDKQRASMNMQYNVSEDKRREDVEEGNKKEYSISSIKMMEAEAGKTDQHGLNKEDSLTKNQKYQVVTQKSAANILNKVDAQNPTSRIGIPKHRKVTHHEYEVETSNGRTIKRRRTKSTVMFGEPTEHKSVRTKTPKPSKDLVHVRRVIRRTPRPSSSIGDLFSEGSLNPYADDPYAFD